MTTQHHERRVVPALATAFAFWFGVALLSAQVLRKHYFAPLTTIWPNGIPNGLEVDYWWTKDGVRLSDAEINSAMNTLGFSAGSGGGNVTVGSGAVSVDPIQYLSHHGYALVSSYQPDSPYWPFQWIEFGWLTLLTATLIALTLILLRRRSS